MSNIPSNIRLKVWSEAAGRCQFTDCNIPLWHNTLTLGKRNFGEMAHIIGAKEGGPRGSDLSKELEKDPENIILLCDRCHKEVDGVETRKNYPVDRLKKMKSDHTTRVRMLLEQPSNRSRPLLFTSAIGGQQSMFGDISITEALLPDFPDQIRENWLKIEFGSFQRDILNEWGYVKSKIDQLYESTDRVVKNGDINHLSIFGLAPQPLLMYLGRKLGDKISAQIFEPRRTDILKNKWKWDTGVKTDVQYEASKLKEGKDKNVILLIALSDFLKEDKYVNMVQGEPHIYNLSIKEPVQGFLIKRIEKAHFIKKCRVLLNKIQNEVGKDCIIHILPAMPASLAIEFGRLLQPTKDPRIWVYENIDATKPVKVIELI
jgi:hypothetical protein